MAEPKSDTVLVNCQWLMAHRRDPQLVLLDASMPLPGATASSEICTIAGARRFDIDSVFSDKNQSLPHMMLSAEQFESEARSLGINNDSVIIVFDNLGIYSAPRAWWMLNATGAQQVAILNGGLAAWKKIRGETANHYAAAQHAGDFIAKPQANYFCDLNYVREALGDSAKAVIDARSADRFFGRVDEPRPGLRRGHMPGAFNLPFDSLLKDQGYREVDDIKQQLDQLTANKQQVIFSCGSGVTACVLAAAAKMAGVKNVCVYDGSWTEWGGREDLPATNT